MLVLDWDRKPRKLDISPTGVQIQHLVEIVVCDVLDDPLLPSRGISVHQRIGRTTG